MGVLNETSFNLADTESQEFSGGTRKDVRVDGSVNVTVVVNGNTKTLGTITDDADNVYMSGSIFLTATGGAAVGSVTSVEE